ncbi:hypothetical protein [Erythrobacter crassostreae]|uniref:Uncharacterized protein n=1 Tax=Erythrobacter crassostreae TaxID=2828328 RepID=A0A9X1JNZ8_9SPHN|nr:hypothetical protein [Erythrobacter crassostrea]MBV7258907.1 hypothetical protein [Erythrobacter crassostrea]
MIEPPSQTGDSNCQTDLPRQIAGAVPNAENRPPQEAFQGEMAVQQGNAARPCRLPATHCPVAKTQLPPGNGLIRAAPCRS